MTNICWSQINKNYFSIDENNICSICGVRKNPLFIVSHWRKTTHSINLVCENCLTKKKEHSIIEEKRMVLFVKEFPYDAVPVFQKPPELQDSKRNISVFQAADQQLANEITKDKTVYAGRESFEGLKIGNVDFKALEQKDKPLQLEQGKKLLKGLKDATNNS